MLDVAAYTPILPTKRAFQDTCYGIRRLRAWESCRSHQFVFECYVELWSVAINRRHVYVLGYCAQKLRLISVKHQIWTGFKTLCPILRKTTQGRYHV
jgi:hypothetical protein